LKAVNEVPEDEPFIVGHSYGADAAAAVAAAACHKINLLVTIDPVSRFTTEIYQGLPSLLQHGLT
jgi:pimeloyl-ACP methyl ester carboxylesterase